MKKMFSGGTKEGLPSDSKFLEVLLSGKDGGAVFSILSSRGDFGVAVRRTTKRGIRSPNKNP